MRPQATASVQVDEQQLRSTLWSFDIGAETGWHVHQHDYLVVPASDGELLIDTGTEQLRFPLKVGQSYFRKAGVAHNVINGCDHPIAFVEVELTQTQIAPA
ncbi:MAG: cupin [Betaproteobacteria bacterium]|jgi:quercetin dioxygenase-like cupin family protein|nr:cupin [Pseudomonadota bacterium]NBO03132.1 cupin [Betaproteobacteria bacterium]HAB48419.1 cupin [Lautropia sp.]NBO95651.1 cupin [Betaproteobacteria bacterium]NBP35060.1 cupin [Betaproteobacteria bacterium]